MIITPEQFQIHKPKCNLEEIINKTEIKEKILYKKISDFHNITIVQNKVGKFIKYKDTYQAGEFQTNFYSGNIPYVNYFLIPYLMNKNIQNILLVGFGSGILVKQFTYFFENLKKIDIVDIEENIFPLAQQYFNFTPKENMNFYLQDAIVFLNNNKKKYDLIIVDVAGNEGIDERFCTVEYLDLIKKHLKKGGIFVSNLPSSRDIFNKKNSYILNLIKDYQNIFTNVLLYNGETSNKIYYKAFFDINESVYDITNLIIISSDKKYNLSTNYEKFKKYKIPIEKYLKDLINN